MSILTVITIIFAWIGLIWAVVMIIFLTQRSIENRKSKKQSKFDRKIIGIVKNEIDNLNIKSDIKSRLGCIPNDIKQSEEKILSKLKASCFKKVKKVKEIK